MKSIVVKARAKINLALDILGKRPDGYHDVCMIMQTLKLHDSLLIKKVDKYPFKLVTDHDKLPVDERNLVYKAAMRLIQEYDIKQGIFISLRKKIPLSAGLAGGSSDCAAALVGMNQLLSLNIPMSRLMEMGKQLGADVPFCLMGGTALAEGIGERLTRLPPHPSVWVLLARPPVAVSTPYIFNRFDLTPVTNHPAIQAMKEALFQQNVAGIAALFCNVLTDVTAEMHPEIYALINLMRKYGALNAAMSGSGPTVFGYFSTRLEAIRALSEIKKSFPHVRDLILTGIHNDKEMKGLIQ